METFLFVVFGIIAVIAGAMVIFSRNPVYSALNLVLTLFAVSALYVLLHAYFIAAVQIVVYAGAIVVLFLFVIMLLNVGDQQALREDRAARTVVGGLLGLAFAAIAATVVWTSVQPARDVAVSNVLEDAGHTQRIGRLLFQNYLLPFEITSVILLAALVGIVVLVRFHGRPRADRDSSR